MSKKAGKKVTEKEIDELRNQLARALADYDNLTKRIEKEKEGLVKFASFDIVKKVLPILDMFADVQKHLNDTGLTIAIKEFEQVLTDEGVERIPAGPGVQFDEHVHEAVEVIQDKKQKGKIVEQTLSGWQYKDGPIVRPAKVKVGA